MKGMFCKIYGNSIRNRIIELMLEHGSLDFSAGDIAEDAEVSRPKAYEILYLLEKQSIIKKSRIVAGTQLYKFNNDSLYSRMLKKSFNECLKMAVQEKIMIKK